MSKNPSWGRSSTLADMQIGDVGLFKTSLDDACSIVFCGTSNTAQCSTKKSQPTYVALLSEQKPLIPRIIQPDAWSDSGWILPNTWTCQPDLETTHFPLDPWTPLPWPTVYLSGCGKLALPIHNSPRRAIAWFNVTDKTLEPMSFIDMEAAIGYRNWSLALETKNRHIDIWSPNTSRSNGDAAVTESRESSVSLVSLT